MGNPPWTSMNRPGDGSLLAIGDGNGFQLWDLRSVRRRLSAMGLDWETEPSPSDPPEAAPIFGGEIVGL